jgi:hypothetical protein
MCRIAAVGSAPDVPRRGTYFNAALMYHIASRANSSKPQQTAANRICTSGHPWPGVAGWRRAVPGSARPLLPSALAPEAPHCARLPALSSTS